MKEVNKTFEAVVSLYRLKTFLRLRLSSLRLKIKAPKINRGSFLKFVFMSFMDRKLLFENTVGRLKIIQVLFPKFF